MKHDHPIQYNHSRMADNRGFTLMPIILMIMIFTAMISVGVLLIGPMTKRGKTVDTQKTVDGAISSIISWSIANNRIPDATALPSATGFLSVAGNPKDAYGNSLVYIYDSNLTSPLTGGICGRGATALTIRSCSDAACTTYTDIPNVAFVVLSSGENSNNQTAVSGPSASPINVYTVGLNVDNYAGDLGGPRIEPYDDLFKIITLDELKNKAGCYGPTQGRLKILNNELPKACLGPNPYPATVFAEGGVPSYNWTVTGAPAWLRCNGGPCTGSFTGTSILLSAGLTITTGGTVTFSLTDSDSNNTQKALQINVISCP